MKLPYLQTASNTRSRQDSFGGYNHTLGAVNGEIYDMKNLTSDYYPLLASRPKRKTLANISNPHGLYACDSLYYVAGTTLYKDGVSVGSVEASDKRFAALGERVIIFPDKKIYEPSSGQLKSLESKWSGGSITFRNGTYAGEDADANTIYVSGVTWSNYFSVGDAVTISGCTTKTENNKTPIIREISGNELRFYENTFTLPTDATTYTESGTMKIERTVPDLDYICTNENRVWGCKGDEIWASKLGDPYNWNVYDGVSTDSFMVESGTPGDFTACISFLGYPVFFKEDKILKVYGSYPSNYQTSASATLGVMSGCDKSVAVAGETLYYMSRSGIVAYGGGIPQSINTPFGSEKYTSAVGGSDGVKYYISMKDSSNNYSLFAFDTTRQMWHKEDSTQVKYFAYKNGLIMQTATAHIVIGGASGTDESSLDSIAEFGDFDYQSMNSKHVVRLRLRLMVGSGATLTIKAKFDNGAWENVKTISSQAKGLVFVPVQIKRCDHYRLKLEASGAWQLHAIEYEYYSGGRK